MQLTKTAVQFKIRENEPGQHFLQIDCAPSEDPEQPANLQTLISVFAMHSVSNKESKHFHANSKDWSVYLDAQADLSLRWMHM